MQELPLFPLNTVLFPGMPLSLHIFEERYKEMINLCLDQRQPFGVVLIREGREVGATADPHSIGCTAHITHVNPLGDGRLNLLAVGRERFRTLELRGDRPYLVGVVESLSLSTLTLDVERAIPTRLRPLVQKYLDVLSEVSEEELDMDQLPTEPLGFSYLAASLLQVPLAHKQSLLAIDDAGELVDSLVLAYRREISVLRAMLSPPDPQVIAMGPFSSN